jgi:hypothetical protein
MTTAMIGPPADEQRPASQSWTDGACTALRCVSGQPNGMQVGSHLFHAVHRLLHRLILPKVDKASSKWIRLRLGVIRKDDVTRAVRDG